MSATAPSDPFSLAGQVALVTGGGTGLGEAIAAGLHRAGARPSWPSRPNGSVRVPRTLCMISRRSRRLTA
jgi:hypothetical protein